MAADGNWVSAPAKRRGLVDYVKLKYYHWCLWTGIYMLDTRERAALNSIVLVLLALLARVRPPPVFSGRAVGRASFSRPAPPRRRRRRARSVPRRLLFHEHSGPSRPPLTFFFVLLWPHYVAGSEFTKATKRVPSIMCPAGVGRASARIGVSACASAIV